MISRILLSTMIVLSGCSLSAQTLTFRSDDPDRPIEVVADQGIEWQQEDRRFIARGAAKARQGDVEVLADQLVAYYRDGEGGGTDVHRVDAFGDVTIRSDGEIATGSSAAYDFDQAVLVIQGESVRLETIDGVVEANETIQYWGEQNVAVAEGRAVATRGEQTLFADTLTAHFKEAGANSSATTSRSGELSYIEGHGNVKLETKGDIILGDRGRYNLETGIATLDGNVRITSDQNQLSGGFAVVDTNRGVSTLHSTSQEAGVRGPTAAPRVRALILPDPKGVTESPKSE